jgi:hypothetical protein
VDATLALWIILGPIMIALYVIGGVIYLGDQARRAVGLGPPVTTIEAQLIVRPTDDAWQAGSEVDVCIAKHRGPIMLHECIHRWYSNPVSDGTRLDSQTWAFNLSVDNAPSSLCLFFSRCSRPPYSRVPIGSLCLSEIPSPGVVRIGSITCSPGSPGDCKARDVTREGIKQP